MSESLEAWTNYAESDFVFDPERQCVTIIAPEQLQQLRRWSRMRLKLHGLTDSDLIDDVLIVVAECGNNAVNYDRPASFRKGTVAIAVLTEAVQITVLNPLPPTVTRTPAARDASTTEVNARLQPESVPAFDAINERGRGLGICGVLCADRGGSANAAIVMTSDDVQLKITATLPYDTSQ